MNISTSQEQLQKMLDNKVKEEVVYSFFPCDHWKCDCQAAIMDIKTRFSQMSPKQIEEFKSKTKVVRCKKGDKKTRYEIKCNSCKSIVAECAADNDKLENWCDLHYIATSYIEKGKGEVRSKWKGALAVNVSPIDGKIGIECCCGVDTRDFRANSTLEGKELKRRIEDSLVGRLFEEEDSKFKAIEKT